MSNSFKVTDKTGVTLFEASPSEVKVGANTLQVTGQVNGTTSGLCLYNKGIPHKLVAHG